MFLYSFLFTVGFLVLLPRFILDALRGGKYADGFRQRLGDVPRVEAGGRPVVWLHCVSVGETQAARSVVEELLAAHPEYALVVSTTTLTGQRIAREVFGKRAAGIIYFPFDWRWTVRRALGRVRPNIVLIMETELWANFLRECRRRRIPVALVNGRLSQKSARNYRLVRFLMRRVTNDLTLALMQSESDAARIKELGIAPERVHVTGNVKFDAAPPAATGTAELDARFRVAHSSRPLIVFASTHDGEETLLFRALDELNHALPALRPRVLVAPRRPERFAAVAQMVQATGMRWTRRSSLPAATDAVCDAVLLDTIGELPATYALANAVFVGGSLVPHGGHNILEPAAASRAIVTGAHTANFDSIMRAFRDAGALVQLPPAPPGETITHLTDAFRTLLTDAKMNRRLGERAAAVCQANQGATKRTMRLLDEVFNTSARNCESNSSPAQHIARAAEPQPAADAHGRLLP